jgi:tRNA-dihydrouridine synthase B
MKDYWKKQAEKWKMCFLAPMDGYWDSAYRQAMKKIAPDIYAISEFYSADWLVNSKFLADSVLPHSKAENPLVIQIFWKNPENFAKAAKIIERYDVVWIDVNMWCPAKKVVQSWHWSGLLINQCVAFKIIEELNKATNLPISVKTRLWFDWSKDLINFAKWLENAWASLLTVHGRTAKQAYTWFADFTDIYELKNHINIPLICNGDIVNFDDGMTKVKNLDWFMIGRWSFWNPWCFLPWWYQPTLEEILNTMLFHAEKLVETKWDHKWSLEIRKHLVQYLKSFPWVKNYRKRLVTVENYDQTKEVIEDIRLEFTDFLGKIPAKGEIL